MSNLGDEFGQAVRKEAAKKIDEWARRVVEKARSANEPNADNVEITIDPVLGVDAEAVRRRANQMMGAPSALPRFKNFAPGSSS